MELRREDGVTVVLSAIALRASLWGIFGAVFLGLGFTQLVTGIPLSYETGNLLGLLPAVGYILFGAVFLARLFASELNVLDNLAAEVEERWGLITTQEGKTIRGSIFRSATPRQPSGE